MKTNVVKTKIINLLSENYEISNELKGFIDAISENADEAEDLTIMALSLFPRTKNMTPVKSSVIIVNLSSKIHLIKAVKEALNAGLKESKDIVDALPLKYESGRWYSSVPITLGPGHPISVYEWTEIIDRLRGIGVMESILL